jgi:formate hydrogenlyase transcriptional activator
MANAVVSNRSAPVKVPSRSDASDGERRAFERLLGQLSARFANVQGEQVESEIKDALRKIREFLGFDRSSFCEYQDGSLVVLSTDAAEGIEPMALGQVSKEYAWYRAKANAGEMIVLQGVPEDLPPEARSEAEYARRTNLRSHLGIPVRIGDQLVGIIALAAFREVRLWPDDLIARLRLVGEIVAQAIARKRADEKLKMAIAENDALKDRLERENASQQATHVRLPQGLKSRSSTFLSVLHQIQQVARTGSTVLLLGETGTGKEVLAQAIHDASARKRRPMIKVNCAALPAALIESELFGREKGAFTGALARQAGRFEIAHDSTIFLDEVGELPVELQTKLLRVLQEGEFERLGGTQTIKVDARVIAATNRDLAQAVSEGKFREDLFYRLDVFPINVPALRERSEDIPMLSWAFVKEFSNSMGKPINEIADDSMISLLTYPWPGNIRELRNVIERAMILTSGPTLHVKLNQTSLVSKAATTMAGVLEEVEREHILRALERSGGRIRGSNAAAELLGIKPTTLEARIKKLGLAR